MAHYQELLGVQGIIRVYLEGDFTSDHASKLMRGMLDNDLDTEKAHDQISTIIGMAAALEIDDEYHRKKLVTLYLKRFHPQTLVTDVKPDEKQLAKLPKKEQHHEMCTKYLASLDQDSAHTGGNADNLSTKFMFRELKAASSGRPDVYYSTSVISKALEYMASIGLEDLEPVMMAAHEINMLSDQLITMTWDSEHWLKHACPLGDHAKRWIVKAFPMHSRLHFWVGRLEFFASKKKSWQGYRGKVQKLAQKAADLLQHVLDVSEPYRDCLTSESSNTDDSDDVHERHDSMASSMEIKQEPGVAQRKALQEVDTRKIKQEPGPKRRNALQEADTMKIKQEPAGVANHEASQHIDNMNIKREPGLHKHKALRKTDRVPIKPERGASQVVDTPSKLGGSGVQIKQEPGLKDYQHSHEYNNASQFGFDGIRIKQEPGLENCKTLYDIPNYSQL